MKAKSNRSGSHWTRRSSDEHNCLAERRMCPLNYHIVMILRSFLALGIIDRIWGMGGTMRPYRNVLVIKILKSLLIFGSRPFDVAAGNVLCNINELTYEWMYGFVNTKRYEFKLKNGIEIFRCVRREWFCLLAATCPVMFYICQSPIPGSPKPIAKFIYAPRVGNECWEMSRASWPLHK